MRKLKRIQIIYKNLNEIKKKVRMMGLYNFIDRYILLPPVDFIMGTKFIKYYKYIIKDLRKG